MKLFFSKILLLLSLGLLSQPLRAQQDAMFTQYMFNTLAINPAYAGSNEVITMTGLFRKQWVNIEGAPSTATFSIDAPVWGEKMGLGLNIVSDRVGITNTLGVFASYAYRIKTSEKGRLALGLQAGFSQYAADLQSVALGSTPSFDPAFAENISQMMPNVGGGIWYNNDRFYAGFSVPHIINNALNRDYQFLNDSDGARQYRHYFVTAGYVFDLNAALKLKPSFLVKVVEGAPMQMDINANLWLYEKVGLGLSYRSGDSIDALLEFQLSHQFKLGYAYDYTLTELRRYNSGSHEIMLRYQFSVNRSKIITPRFF